jgi:hypothetical protein
MLDTALSRFHLLLYLLLPSSSDGQSFSTSLPVSSATATNNTATRTDDSVDFSTITAWPKLSLCLKQQLQLYDGGVANWIECYDNYCLCSQKFAEAESALASDALLECSYTSAMAAATSILSEY